MNEIPTWTERPQVIRYLLNPAFCAEVLRTASRGYSEKSKRPMPYPLLFILLGLLLHKPTRESLPKSSKTHFLAWVEANPKIRINIDERIRSLVPFTKEALIFLMNENFYAIDDSGGVLTMKYSKAKTDQVNEKEDILKKADLLGKLLSKSGTVQATYAILGIRP